MTRPFNPRLRIKTDYVTALAVTLAPVFYFLPAILSGRVLCPNDGIIQNVPLRVATANIIRAGNLPLWNPFYFSGSPLLASSQAGVLLPLNWYYLFFSPAAATNLMVVSTYMLAALGAYLYSRRTGATITAAMVTSIVWQAGGVLVGQLGHINIVQTAAILPWVLWALERYTGKGRRARGALLAGFVAVQAFAGHQQTFAYSLLLVTVYAIVMALGQVQTRKHYFRSLTYVAAGVLLAAVQLLPTFELLRNSQRAEATYGFLTSFSMPPRFVLTLLAPYVLGGGDGRLFRAAYISEPFYGEFIAYTGLLAIMLALVSVLLNPDRRTKFWAAIALLGTLLALGSYAPLRLYRLIYYVPVLNLFRVPARHMMEVDFAIAVLAGRGVTVLARLGGDKRRLRRVAIAAGGIVLLTFLAVTWLRPANFLLAREAPVTLLRAPELFLPILIAALSAWALWRFARGRRGSTATLIAILVIDLSIWGQSSGWYTASPMASEEYWRTPETVRLLQEKAPQDRAAYRILTVPHAFDPAKPPVPPSVSHATDWGLWTQPDVYMMHGIQNAAGYDGLVQDRYSRLAGQMKVWGELTDPDATLRRSSRAMDLLNVRYLLSMRKQPGKVEVDFTSSSTFPPASEKHGRFMFASGDLGLPSLGANQRLSFAVTPVAVDHVALLTNLAWSENVPENTIIGRVRLTATDGRTFEFSLRAGMDTAEWAYDRADIRARIKHRRPAVATSYPVKDVQGNYEAHTYVTSFALPEKIILTDGEITVEPVTSSPDLLLSVFRLSLVDASENKTYPLKREWLSIENGGTPAESQPAANTKDERWKLLAQTPSVDIYENSYFLPRAWLASEFRVLPESSLLEVIRTGKLPDGSNWNPLRTALLESGTSDVPADAARDQSAEITNYEPNRVSLKTSSSSSSILVLSENHYPGWRAYIDGRGVDVLRVDYNLRGLMLGPGEHQVDFVYRPKSVLLGLLISLITLAMLMLLAVRQTRKESGGPRDEN